MADLVIVDYGLSFNEAENEEDSLTDTGEPIGNRFYRRPELTLPGGDKRDPRSDLGSLTAIFYYCLTGRPPYQPLDGYGKLPHQREGGSVRDLLKDHPRLKDVEAILDRGFAPDFESGFHTPQELAERLQALLMPAGPHGGRDLAQVSRDAAAKLRRHNRPARLAELAEKLMPLKQHLSGLTGDVLRSLEPIFTPAVTGNIDLPTPPGVDKLNVEDLSISVGVKGTDAAVYAVFRFAAEREQCILLRCITTLVQKDLDRSRPWVKLKWFPFDDAPTEKDVLPLIREGLAIAIEELVEMPAEQ
jgi:serine/threonine protein kinase